MDVNFVWAAGEVSVTLLHFQLPRDLFLARPKALGSCSSCKGLNIESSIPVRLDHKVQHWIRLSQGWILELHNVKNELVVSMRKHLGRFFHFVIIIHFAQLSIGVFAFDKNIFSAFFFFFLQINQMFGLSGQARPPPPAYPYPPQSPGSQPPQQPPPPPQCEYFGHEAPESSETECSLFLKIAPFLVP